MAIFILIYHISPVPNINTSWQIEIQHDIRAMSMQNYVYGSGAGLMVSDCPNTQVRPRQCSRLRLDVLHEKQRFSISVDAKAGVVGMGPLGF